MVPGVNLNITSEEEFILDLLDIKSSFSITHDTVSHELMEVSLDAIWLILNVGYHYPVLLGV